MIKNDSDISGTKFPKSVNNKQCIGPCYPPGKFIMHPETLEYITDKVNPFCPTERWFNEKENHYQRIDSCLIASKQEEIDKMQVELSFIIPTFHFNCEHFLEVYYDIFSFEGAIDWVTENIKNPIYSNLRIMDCAWKIYGSNLDIIFDQLIDFYIYVIKKEGIKDIFPLISKYIFIDKKNNIFLKEHKNNNLNNKQIEKINFFIKKFITKQNIYLVLHSYIEKNKSNWNNIKNHNNAIEEFLIQFILYKIQNIINEIT